MFGLFHPLQNGGGRDEAQERAQKTAPNQRSIGTRRATGEQFDTRTKGAQPQSGDGEDGRAQSGEDRKPDGTRLERPPTTRARGRCGLGQRHPTIRTQLRAGARLRKWCHVQLILPGVLLLVRLRQFLLEEQRREVKARVGGSILWQFIEPLLGPELAGHREAQFNLFVGGKLGKLGKNGFIFKTETIKPTRRKFIVGRPT